MSSSIAKQVANTTATNPDAANRNCARCNTACECANSCECGSSCQCPECGGQQTRLAQANKRHDAELLSQPTNHTATGEGKKSDAKS